MCGKTCWFITGMRDQSDFNNRKRCWGFFDNLPDAEHAVLHNYGDIYENEFDFVVVEEQYPGAIATGTGAMYWYKWNAGIEQYERIETPAWAKNLCHWGIG